MSPSVSQPPLIDSDNKLNLPTDNGETNLFVITEFYLISVIISFKPIWFFPCAFPQECLQLLVTQWVHMVEFWCLDPPFSEQILLYRYLRYNCYLVREISIECQEYSCVTLGKKFFCTLWWSRGLASLQPLWRGYQGWIKWVLTLV